jgi:hypothetical protein
VMTSDRKIKRSPIARDHGKPCKQPEAALASLRLIP